MSRVYTYTTRARRKTTSTGEETFYRCSKCGKDILPGQKRYEWSFRYGGTYRQHAECGYPSRSQLTQSKMASVYDAIDNPWGGTKEEIAANLQSASEVVQEVASEYAEAAGAFGNAGENQERADELESFASTLDQAASEVEYDSGEEGESDEECIARLREIAENAASECPY